MVRVLPTRSRSCTIKASAGHRSFCREREKDGEWRTRTLFKRRERTAVDYISSLLKEIANEGHLFVAVNCKTYIELRPTDELGNTILLTACRRM
ncbi:hypothetical protein RHS01_01775 [Rhizoctonia solani]|uniref:Uncharacterized protein n=1 Tax=Rhizoctonia solani TaxID=456999 RepID=A0A8H7IKI7_9AGAM|nr:hypothetical protein RHS01_01775 [Rhizoctonia solani]